MKAIDSYKDLPLGMYLDILRIDEDETLDDLGRQVAVLAVLTGLKESEILQLPLGEYAANTARLAFLQQDVPEPLRPIGKTIVIGGVKYGVPQSPAKISTAQFVDFRAYAGKWKERPIPELLSTLLVPEGHKYADGYEVEDVQAALRSELDTVTAFALSAFFLRSWSQFIEASLYSLERPIKKLKRRGQTQKAAQMEAKVTELRTILQQSGDGLTMLWPFRRLRILRGTPSGTWDASNS